MDDGHDRFAGLWLYSSHLSSHSVMPLPAVIDGNIVDDDDDDDSDGTKQQVIVHRE